MQQALEQNILQAVKQVEDQIDSELHRLENLDEDELEKLRLHRIDEMKKMQQKHQDWLHKGHGQYQEVDEKEFFKEIKGEERCICHFYRDSFPCKIIDKHMAELASQHIETKFIKVHAEKAPFLTERLKIWMLPTLAIIKHEKTTDYVVGLDDLGGEDFKVDALVARLSAVGAIFEDPALRPKTGTEDVPVRTVRPGFKKTESDEDSDFE